MTAAEPKGPYIYQPYGMQDKEHWRTGRIYAVAGVSILATVKGLTKDEAAAVLLALSPSHRTNADAGGANSSGDRKGEA